MRTKVNIFIKTLTFMIVITLFLNFGVINSVYNHMIPNEFFSYCFIFVIVGTLVNAILFCLGVIVKNDTFDTKYALKFIILNLVSLALYLIWGLSYHP
jgi:hypothetical protein